jgi:hypothetical protein
MPDISFARADFRDFAKGVNPGEGGNPGDTRIISLD